MNEFFHISRQYCVPCNCMDNDFFSLFMYFLLILQAVVKFNAVYLYEDPQKMNKITFLNHIGDHSVFKKNFQTQASKYYTGCVRNVCKKFQCVFFDIKIRKKVCINLGAEKIPHFRYTRCWKFVITLTFSHFF